MTDLTKARLRLDRRLAATTSKTWEKVSPAIGKRIARLLQKDQHDEALEYVRDLNLLGYFEGNAKEVRMIAAQAVMLGAGQVSPVRKTKVRSSEDAVQAIDRANEYYLESMEESTEGFRVFLTNRIRDHLILRQAQKDEEIRKALPDFGLETTEEYFTQATESSGKRMNDMNASLMNSRLSNYGFVLEANLTGITYYRVRAVLDVRTGPVDRIMHGKVFPTTSAASTLNPGFQNNRPEGWKALQPWYPQNKQSIKRLEGFNLTQLQALGLHLPPYHPNCRCVIIPATEAEYYAQPLAPPPPTAPPSNAPPEAFNRPTFHEQGTSDIYENTIREVFRGDDTVAQFLDDVPAALASEAESLTSYTGGMFNQINAFLRDGKVTHGRKVDDYVWVQSAIDSAIVKAVETGLGYSGKVYRGVEANAKLEKVLEKIEPGNIFRDPAFLSTSRDKGLAKGIVKGAQDPPPYRTIFEIEAKGKKGIDVQEYSVVYGEDEVLFGSGTEFRIISVMIKNDVRHVHMEEL